MDIPRLVRYHTQVNPDPQTSVWVYDRLNHIIYNTTIHYTISTIAYPLHNYYIVFYPSWDRV